MSAKTVSEEAVQTVSLRQWIRLIVVYLFIPLILSICGMVCDTGPYRSVRHPGYAGSMLPLFGIVLALDSVLPAHES